MQYSACNMSLYGPSLTFDNELLITTAVLQEKHQDSVVNTAAIGQNGDIF